jgi:hypothetical protein
MIARAFKAYVASARQAWWGGVMFAIGGLYVATLMTFPKLAVAVVHHLAAHAL